MTQWLEDLPVAWMTIIVLGSLLLAVALINLAVARLARGALGTALGSVSAGLLPPLGIIFGLLVGFVAAQVWSDFDKARAAVNQEAGSLREIVLIAASFGGDTEARLSALVREHIERSVTVEWPEMAAQTATVIRTSAPLAEALRLTFSLDTEDQGHASAERALAEAVEGALDARRQRIIISKSSVNWVRWTGIIVQGFVTLVAIAVVQSGNRLGSAIAMTLFAVGMALSIVVIAAYDGPFKGEISVTPEVLLQVMPEGTQPASGE